MGAKIRRCGSQSLQFYDYRQPGQRGERAHGLCLEIEVRRRGADKRLRDENARIRKLVADLSSDKEALQSVVEKSTVRRWIGNLSVDGERVCANPFGLLVAFALTVLALRPEELLKCSITA